MQCTYKWNNVYSKKEAVLLMLFFPPSLAASMFDFDLILFIVFNIFKSVIRQTQI